MHNCKRYYACVTRVFTIKEGFLMNKNSKRLTAALLTLIVFAAAACTLRTLACLRHLESNMIYFSSTGLITAANVVVVCAAVLLCASAFTLTKEPLRADFTSPVTYVPTGIAGVALLVFGLAMLALYSVSDSPLPNPRIEVAGSLALICALLTPLSAVHFLLSAFLSERHARIRGYFALATVLLCAAYASYLYFAPGSPINAPNKTVEQMAYLFISLFFLYETRISLAREMWRSYAAFGLVAALIGVYASLPALLAYFIKGIYVTATVESAVLLISLSIFIFARVCMMAMAAPDGECPEMAVLRRFAERREEELNSGKIEDGTQISITELIDIPTAHADADDEQEDAMPPEDITESIEETIETENDIGAIDA